MSIFDNENLIEIKRDDINDASVSSNHLADDIKRRAFANVLGARLGIKFLAMLGAKADNFDSLYTIPAILNDIDISDIKTDNNIKIDVRIVEDENHLCIPKSHYEFDILPDIYIFIKIFPDFSYASYIGAIAPDEVDKSIENQSYYFLGSDLLYNENSLKKVLEKGKAKSNYEPDENEVVRASGMLVNFIDGDILNNEKHFVYKVLKDSKQLRKLFSDFEKFEMISADLAHTDEILSDSVLDVLGAQEIYKNDLSETDIGSDIDLDELALETAADFVEEYIEDDKDNGMFDNNEIIEGEFNELPDDTEIEEAGELEALPTDEELASFADSSQDMQEDEVNDDEIQNIGSFEGFEGLGTDNDISFDDFTAALEDSTLEGDSVNDQNDSTLELKSDDVLSDSESINNLNEENISSEIEQEDFTQINTNSQFEVSNNIAVDEIANIEEFEPVENLEQNIEPESLDLNLSDADNNNEILTANEEVDDLNIISEELIMPNEDIDMENNDDTNLNTAEILDNSDIQNGDIEDFELTPVTELEELQPVIDLSLPELEPITDVQNISEESTDNIEVDDYKQDNVTDSDDEKINDNDFSALDNIAQSINFETEQTNETPLDFNSNSESINELEEQTELEMPDNSNPNEATNNEENDFSGLEEFTMDMAKEYEKANPDVFNSPKRENVSLEYNENDFNMMSSPINNSFEQENLNTDEHQDFTNDNTENTSNDEVLETNDFQLETLDNNLDLNLEPVENIADLDISNIQEENLTEKIDTQNSIETDIPVLQNDFTSELEPLEIQEIQPEQNEDFSNGYNIDDMTSDSDIDSISFDNLTADDNSTADLSNVNLDELDSDDGDFNFVESYDFEQNNKQNIDMSNIDSEIDNIMNNPDFDINELDLDNIDLNDPNLNIENLDIDMSDINMNDISNIQDISNMPNMPNMPQDTPQDIQSNVQDEQYIPDFNGNDQNTIEALYNENTQNQPGEAINQSFDANNVNVNINPQPTAKKKNSAPLLGIALIALIVAFGFMKKDLILDKINSQKGVSVEQEQNMPVEGETQEDKEDAELLNDNENPDANQEQINQGIGDIPGEAGGPQDAASMEESLHQKGSQINSLPNSKYSNTPEPLASSDIKRLYWEIPQDLTYNDDIVKYLKTVGKTMKFAIQSDLLNISEMPYSNKMIVNITIKKDGSFDNVNTTVSSGSKQIDAVVLQSVKAALKYVKAPTAEFRDDSYNFSLIINF